MAPPKNILNIMEAKETFTIPEELEVDEGDLLPIIACARLRSLGSTSCSSSRPSIDDSRLPPSMFSPRNAIDDEEIMRRADAAVERNRTSVVDDLGLGAVAGILPKSKIVRKKRLVDDWNSTSTLFVNSTMNKPDISRTVRAMSNLIAERMTDASIPSVFDEGRDTFRSYRRIDNHSIYRMILNIFYEAQLTNECIVMSWVYLNRLLETWDSEEADGWELELSTKNVRPIIMTTLLLSSKVWDDISMWNVDFTRIHPFFYLNSLNSWERYLLAALDYNIIVTGSCYAEAYFELRTFEIKISGELDSNDGIAPLTEDSARELEVLSRRRSETLLNQTTPRAISMALPNANDIVSKLSKSPKRRVVLS